MGGNRTFRIRRATQVLGGIRPGAAALLAATIGLCVALGCATPEERYRTLSLFFDDVPLPQSMRPDSEFEPATSPTETGLQRAERPVPEWTIHDPGCEDCHTAEKTGLTYIAPPDLCWDCHDVSDFVDAVPHGPFAAGACLQCHSPHKSQYQALLRSPPAELCASCHDAATDPGLEDHRSSRGEDCVGCHDPHAGPAPYMLEERAAAARVPARGRRPGTQS